MYGVQCIYACMCTCVRIYISVHGVVPMCACARVYMSVIVSEWVDVRACACVCARARTLCFDKQINGIEGVFVYLLIIKTTTT